jgi:hypothetical protein
MAEVRRTHPKVERELNELVRHHQGRRARYPRAGLSQQSPERGNQKTQVPDAHPRILEFLNSWENAVCGCSRLPSILDWRR